MLDKVLKTCQHFVPAKWHWIFEHQGVKKYLSGVSWLLFGQLFSAAVSFAVGVFAARQLGLAEYGLLNYVVSFITIFGFVANLGVYDVLRREAVGCDDLYGRKLLGSSWFLCFCGYFIASVAIIVALFLLGHDLVVGRFILLFSLIFLFQTLTIIEVFFQAQVKFSLPIINNHH